MEFDNCANSNEDLDPHSLPGAVAADVSLNDTCEAVTAPCDAPCVDDIVQHGASANCAMNDENPVTGREKHGSEAGSDALKRGKATAAASTVVASSMLTSSRSKAELRSLYSHSELVKRSGDNKLYRAGSSLIFSLGNLNAASVFHTRRYILPFGFTSVRSFTSFVQPNMQCPYICEILDGGDGNLAHFRVTCIDDVEQPVVALSPSAAWRQVLRMIRAQAQHQGIEVNISDHVNGLVMFGVVHPSIQQTLRGLTGTARCRSMDYFEHKTGYEDGIDVDVIDASSHVPDSRLLPDDLDDVCLRSTVPPNNFLNELDQHVSEIMAATPLSRRASEDSSEFVSLPDGLSHDEVAHVVSVISADEEMSAAEAEVFDKVLAHVRSTSAHSPSFSSLSDGKHDVLCWWHMHEAASAANGFSRSLELLRKARDELAHHHTQLVQVSNKYEKSVFKNAKLEDSFSATRRELEEFKRKDVENAKAIKQGQFMAREYKRVQRELQEKTDAEAAAENVIDWRLTTDELATRRRQVVLLERNVEFLRNSLERARCDALFHTGAADTHRQAMTSVRLQVASVRSVLVDAIAACDVAGVGADVRERIGTALSMLQTDTLGEPPVFKPHSVTALFVKRLRNGGSIRNCNDSAHSIPMPWKKRVLLDMEQSQFKDESSAAPVVCSQTIPSFDAVNVEPCDSGAVVNAAISFEQNNDLANDSVPQSVGGPGVDCPEDVEGMDG